MVVRLSWGARGALDRYRFLGFAFATADLLIEVEPAGLIVFAVGAAQGLSAKSAADLVGRDWRDLIAEQDHAMVDAMLAGLEAGRCGPITVALAGGSEPRYVHLSACRLPPQTNISCAIALEAPTPIAARTRTDADGYQDQIGFEALAKTVLSAAAAVGQDLDVALIEMPGMAAALDTLGPTKAASLLQRFAGALRAEAFAGAPAGRLGPERFAVIRPRGETAERVRRRLGLALAGDPNARDLTPQPHLMAVEGGVGVLDRSLRALRYAVDSFASEGVSGLAGATLNEAFTRSVQRTLAEAGEFGAIIKARRFNLVFQPIVDLHTGRCRHFETLVRFEEDTSPYKLIRMAEELDLILELDIAIAEQALRIIQKCPRKDLKLAVNVSGRSIMDPWFIAEVRRLTANYGVAPQRLVVEVTESAAIDDLTVADRNIQHLRADGHLVCLDDFGAGASSYAYLQKLHVDV